MATATHSHFMPSTPEEMESFLAHLSDEELRELADNTQQLEERIATYGPQTDDELHEWIKHELHLDIPRTSVCEDHDAPFTFVADVFFERCDAALLMANRGGGKTFMVAIIHWLNSRFKPGCVAADTPIDCPRDHRRYPMGVPISQIQPGQLVWTFNADEFIFELKPVVAAMMTRFGSAIYKLTLDDGGVVRATADHRFMRRDGSWAELSELKPGDSLMPLYRDWEPYVRIRPDATNGGGMVPEYKAVADVVWPERKGFHVDHVDERRENSEPENLQLLTASEHCQKTMKGRKVGKRRRKDTVQQWIDRTEDERDRLAAQISASLKDHQVVRVITSEQREAYREAGKKGGSRPKPQRPHECKECGETYYRQTGGRKGNGFCPLCNKVPLPSNHKVISVEPDGCENVWDMEVEGNHNFVTAGVVLHNCESLTFGAVQNQSNRAYSHLKKWIYDDDGEKKPIVVSSLMSETVLRNGSKIEVLGSTPEQVNGPHPHKAHADEIELMRDDTWKESRNMTVAGMTRDGRVILPQDIMTSTRKGPSGRMQALIDEIEEAIAEGYEPPRAFYKYCIKETAHERPDCQMVDSALREARLVELGEDPCSLCDCNRVRKGKNEDESARLLSDICGGDFFYSRGWQPAAEIKKQFRENDKDTFEVQQLCSKAELKFHYFGSYKDAHHAIRHFEVDPDNGPIFTSTDWGGTNPHSVHWYQLLTVEVEADGWTLLADGTYPRVRVKEGTIVCFDEIYVAEVGNDKLGDMVIARENGYRQKNPTFRITERFADPQGKAARIDWKDKGLRCTWHITREFDEHIKAINSFVVDDDLFRIVAENCPQWRREVKGWRKDEETLKQIDEDNHAMSDFRYAITNIKKLRKKYIKKTNASLPGATGPGRSAPRVTVTTVRRSGEDSPIGLREKGNEYTRWRQSLGEPVSAFRDRGRP